MTSRLYLSILLDMKANDKLVQGVLDITGATCSSCAYTIEHAGRKIQGVEKIFVDVNAKEVHVSYDGNRESLEKVAQIVHTLGYDATVRDSDG